MSQALMVAKRTFFFAAVFFFAVVFFFAGAFCGNNTKTGVELAERSRDAIS